MHETGKTKHIFTSFCILPYFIIYICIFKFLSYRPLHTLHYHCQVPTVRHGEEMIPYIKSDRTFAFLGFSFPTVYQLLYHNNNNNDLNVQSAVSFRALPHRRSPCNAHDHPICLVPIHSDISLADDL